MNWIEIKESSFEEFIYRSSKNWLVIRAFIMHGLKERRKTLFLWRGENFTVCPSIVARAFCSFVRGIGEKKCKFGKFMVMSVDIKKNT